MKNRSHRYDINRPRPRHVQKYTNSISFTTKWDYNGCNNNNYFIN